MASFSHFVGSLLFLPVACVSLSLFIELVYAQTPFKPVSTGDSASVFIEGKAFYIQGGSMQNITTNQAFSISLRTSWSTTNPAYTSLPAGLYDKLFPNTLLSDGTTWFSICNKTFVTYNIPDGKITPRGPASMYSNFSGLSAVFDWGLGEVVIPNGFNNGAQTTNLYIGPGNLITRENPIFPISEISVLLRYSLAWSESYQKAFLFGGSTHSVLSGNLYERHPSPFGNWGLINTTLGELPLTGPSPREAACMVPAFNGTKLILFGGSGPTGPIVFNVALSDIYIYDVAKASWFKGSDAGSKRARAAHACAVSGDALIVWGGFSNLDVKKPAVQMIAVYNLTTNEWVDEFVAPTVKQEPTSISKPSPTGTSGAGSDSGTLPSTSGSGNNTGAIIGGVAAAVVVLAALGLVLWRRGLSKKRGAFLDIRLQGNNREHNVKEPAEKIRDPHSDTHVQSLPRPVPRLARGARHPQLINSQHERELTAEMQLANGARHPQWDMPRHKHGDHKESSDGFHDYRNPIERSKDPHGDLNERSVPWPAYGIHHPQLDISRRKRELAAEMQMLEFDSGEAPAFVQNPGEWSSNRANQRPTRDGSSAHTVIP
ncbi:hypothetical protein BGZ82_004762 [Podila clonocystis]|nr:hypothetical protein BGZ82_004762 [Podila clonocystis]